MLVIFIRKYKYYNMDKILNFDTQASYDAVKDSLEYPTVSYVTDNDLFYFLSKPELYEWVDLGLSVKWAAWNVGATKPEEYGLYFQWGETQGYTGITDTKRFNWSDYKFSIDGSESNFGKYNSTDGLTTLELSDDAASVTQSTCRMPTIEEFEELKSNTTSAWTSVNGVNGVQFTSKVEGYTDKSFFVPAAGNCNDGSYSNYGSVGNCWSSSLYESSSSDAWYLYFNSAYGFSNVGVNNSNRYFGRSVRAVLDK